MLVGKFFDPTIRWEKTLIQAEEVNNENVIITWTQFLIIDSQNINLYLNEIFPTFLPSWPSH